MNSNAYNILFWFGVSGAIAGLVRGYALHALNKPIFWIVFAALIAVIGSIGVIAYLFNGKNK